MPPNPELHLTESPDETDSVGMQTDSVSALRIAPVCPEFRCEAGALLGVAAFVTGVHGVGRLDQRISQCRHVRPRHCAVWQSLAGPGTAGLDVEQDAIVSLRMCLVQDVGNVSEE